MRNPFVQLPQSNLESLRSGFAHGSLRYSVSRQSLTQNGAPPERVDRILEYLSATGFSSEVTGEMISTILQTRSHLQTVVLSQSLVVTGPQVRHSESLKTESRFVQLIESANKELMLATYSLYNGRQILEPVYQAMIRNPRLEVRFIIHVERKWGDQTLSDEILFRHRQEFVEKSWPWEPRPRVYYYPESLCMAAKDRASMHAKFLIADEERCFITSANFTKAAQSKNIEVGVELTGSLEPKALSRYFKELIFEGRLVSLF